MGFPNVFVLQLLSCSNNKLLGSIIIPDASKFLGIFIKFRAYPYGMGMVVPGIWPLGPIKDFEISVDDPPHAPEISDIIIVVFCTVSPVSPPLGIIPESIDKTDKLLFPMFIFVFFFSVKSGLQKVPFLSQSSHNTTPFDKLLCNL